jgi:hypothetical protein
MTVQIPRSVDASIGRLIDRSISRDPRVVVSVTRQGRSSSSTLFIKQSLLTFASIDSHRDIRRLDLLSKLLLSKDQTHKSSPY